MLGSKAGSEVVGRGEPTRGRLAVLWAQCSEATMLVSILLVAGAARIHALDSKSLWLDEAFSVFVARQPLERVMEIIIRHDTPPPLYYTLLHFWLSVGDDPFTARLLSALLGIAGVGAIFLLGREVGGKRVGLIAGLLLATSPFQVWYGQEVRMYTLLALLCTLSAYFLLRSLKTGRWGFWAAYVVATSLAMYTQVSAAFFILAEGVAALAFLWRTAESRARLWLWLSSQAAIALLWLPWLPNFLRQSQTYQQFWIDVPTLATVETLALELTSAYLPHWKVPLGLEIVIAVGMGLVLLSLFAPRRRERIFLLILLVIPVAAMYLVSLSKPIFLSRALIYVSAPYLVLVAGGIAALGRWRLGMLLLCTLVLLNAVSLYRVYTVTLKEEWNLAAGYVTARAAPGDLVLFVASDAQIPFDYYASGEPKPLERRGVPVDVFAVGPLEPAVGPEDLARVDELVAGRNSFWLVESHWEFPDPQQLVRDHLDRRYRLADMREFHGVNVLHYDATMSRPAGDKLEPDAVR